VEPQVHGQRSSHLHPLPYSGCLGVSSFHGSRGLFSPCSACCVRVWIRRGRRCHRGCGMAAPEEDGAVEQEKKLQFNDMNEALVYIAEKMGAIEEVGKATQQEIVLLRKDFLKFMKYIIALAILAICALAGVRLVLP